MEYFKINLDFLFLQKVLKCEKVLNTIDVIIYVMVCPICGDKAASGMDHKEFCKNFLRNCSEDPIFFFENALIIRYIKGKPQFFEPFDWQKKVLRYIQKCVNTTKCEKCEELFGLGDDLCPRCGSKSNHEPMQIRLVVQKGRRVGFSALMAGLHIWFTLVRGGYEGKAKSWNIISASHSQAKELFNTSREMILSNHIFRGSLKMEQNGHECLSKTKAVFVNGNGKIECKIEAFASGGATHRGYSPTGQTFDEAAQIPEQDFNDLDISSMTDDDFQIIGSTPFDDYGFFYKILHPEENEENKKFSGYKKFFVPTIELSAEGRILVENGEHYKLKKNHIKKIRGYRVTYAKLMPRIKKYDHLTFKREVLGEFVSGSDLYYPSSIVKPRIDYHISPIDLDNLTYKKKYNKFLIGVDMAKSVDKTAVVVFGQTPNNSYIPVWWERWSKTDYDLQYEELQKIHNKFSATGIETVMYLDSTGNQKSNLDMMRRLVDDAIGVDFGLPRKKDMANIMYQLLVRNKLTLMWEESIYREITSVTSDLKSTTGHLGDWVAAMWCALSSVEVIGEDDPTVYRDIMQMGMGRDERFDYRPVDMLYSDSIPSNAQELNKLF